MASSPGTSNPSRAGRTESRRSAKSPRDIDVDVSMRALIQEKVNWVSPAPQWALLRVVWVIEASRLDVSICVSICD